MQMKKILVLFCMAGLLFASCLEKKQFPELSTEITPDFETGVKRLADDLSAQIEYYEETQKTFNLFKKQEIQKIVIDPFIDYESGNILKINKKILSILSKKFKDKLTVIGFLEPETLKDADLIITGIVSIKNKTQKTDNDDITYTLYSSMIKKKEQIVIAGTNIMFKYIDTTPIAVYQDNPVFLKGNNYNQYARTSKMKQNDIVEKSYLDNLKVKSMLSKGNNLYEQKDYKGALTYYKLALDNSDEKQLEILALNFTGYIQIGNYKSAESIFSDLLKLQMQETGKFENKILFAVNSSKPLAYQGTIKLYSIYINQIANFVKNVQHCRLEILGHSSRSGKASYNNRLSLKRAQWIKQSMIKLHSELNTKITAIGRGFKDNIVGTGADNITDQIDRRVEFKFYDCN